MATPSPLNTIWPRFWLVSPGFDSHCIWRYSSYSSQTPSPHIRLPAHMDVLLVPLDSELQHLAVPKYRIPPYPAGLTLEWMPSLFCLGFDSTFRAITCVDTSVTLPSMLGPQNPSPGCSHVWTVFILFEIWLPALDYPSAHMPSSASSSFL